MIRRPSLTYLRAGGGGLLETTPGGPNEKEDPPVIKRPSASAVGRGEREGPTFHSG